MALAELAGEMREGLLALAVGTGLQVMAAIMEADVTAVCGPKGRHDPERTAVRHGHGAGSVTSGRASGAGRAAADARGRRLRRAAGGLLRAVLRHRGPRADGAGADAGRALDPPLPGRAGAGRSAHRAGRDAPPHARRCRAGSSPRPRPRWPQLLAADLSQLDLVALMVDGVHFGEHTCVVALGIDIDGIKHPLSLVEGSTENATLVTELIVGLRERGLDVTRPILAVLDGSKALRRAVLDVFDRPVIGRCQLHKIRNVEDQLPEKLRITVVASRMRRAYHADSALAAEAELCALAAELDRTHPGAAASLREGMAETLTVLRLGMPPTLARTLRSTNAIESMISICRTHAGNVKRWRDGQMALRWCAAGMVEAGKQFRRVNGHLHLRSLRDTLDEGHPTCRCHPLIMTPSQPPDDHRAAAEVPRNSGHPPVSAKTC